MKAIKFLLLAMVLGASVVSVEAAITRRHTLTGRDLINASLVPHSNRNVVEEFEARSSAERLGDDKEVTEEACHELAIRMARTAIALVVAAVFGVKAE